MMLSLKVGNVPALVDTGSQFSCIRLEVAEFLNLTGEPYEFRSFSVICSLANGAQCEVTDAVKLHVRLLKFSWDHEFKVLWKGVLFL